MRRFTNKDVYPNRHCRTERGTHFQSFLERYVVKILDGHRDELYGPNQPGFAVGFKYFDHDTPMRNIVLRILAPEPGGPYAIKPTVVVGAHMDTINVFDWDEHVKNADDMPAPGANDNASGVVVLLEALRILAPLFSKRVPTNEVQFHWFVTSQVRPPLFSEHHRLTDVPCSQVCRRGDRSPRLRRHLQDIPEPVLAHQSRAQPRHGGILRSARGRLAKDCRAGGLCRRGSDGLHEEAD